MWRVYSSRSTVNRRSTDDGFRPPALAVKTAAGEVPGGGDQAVVVGAQVGEQRRNDRRIDAAGARLVEGSDEPVGGLALAVVGLRADGDRLGLRRRVEGVHAGRRIDPRVERGERGRLVAAHPGLPVRAQQLAGRHHHLLARELGASADEVQVAAEADEGRVSRALTVGRQVGEPAAEPAEQRDRRHVGHDELRDRRGALDRA